MPSFFHSFLSVGPVNAQVLDFLPDHISSKKSQFFSITSDHSGPMVFELQEAAVEFQRSLGNGLTKSLDASCCCKESLGTITSAGTHLGSLDTITCAGTHLASVVAPTALIWDILLTILPTIF